MTQPSSQDPPLCLRKDMTHPAPRTTHSSCLDHEPGFSDLVDEWPSYQVIKCMRHWSGLTHLPWPGVLLNDGCWLSHPRMGSKVYAVNLVAWLVWDGVQIPSIKKFFLKKFF